MRQSLLPKEKRSAPILSHGLEGISTGMSGSFGWLASKSLQVSHIVIISLISAFILGLNTHSRVRRKQDPAPM